MSDNLPLEVQVEIMKKLPVKSLIQFRSVSKTWKSIINNTHFISTYNGQAPHLLICHEQDYMYLSFADDHTFPQHKVSLTNPQSIDHCNTIGCSHGLLCFYSDYHYYNPGYNRVSMAFLWNLSIRKVVAVVVPNVGDGVVYKSFVGFGVCRDTIDPKIVKITYITKESNIKSIPWQVEVFALSTGVWRRLYNNLPRKSISFTKQHQQVVLDGFIYWLATNRIIMDHKNKTYNMIISFDVTSEEFNEVSLPHCLAHKSCYNLSVSKLRESLVVLELVLEANNLVFVVWMMEDGVLKSFTKLFNANVNTPDYASVLGFRNNGEAVIEIIDDCAGKLVVYEPYSNRIYNLGIEGMKWSFFVCSYKETLLLFDQPNLSVYNGNETFKFEDDLLHEQLLLLI